MRISDIIAGFIQEVLEDKEGCAELQRCELAERFKCVPSQINYVLSTRFSPELGYIVESRRGGGGYIKITRVRLNPEQMIMHAVNAIGDEIDANSAGAFVSNLQGAGVLEHSQAALICAATGAAALRPVPSEHRDTARAAILKQMLIQTISQGG